MGFISRGSTVRLTVSMQKRIVGNESNQILVNRIREEIRAFGYRVISANARRLSSGIVVLNFVFEFVVTMNYQSEAQLGQQLLGELVMKGYFNIGIYVKVVKVKAPVSAWF